MSEYDTTLSYSVTHGSIACDETEKLSDGFLMTEQECVSFRLLVYSNVIGDDCCLNHGRKNRHKEARDVCFRSVENLRNETTLFLFSVQLLSSLVGTFYLGSEHSSSSITS